MKVLIATGIFEPEAGGPAKLAAGLARELEKAGHEAVVLTYAPHATGESYPFQVVRIVRGNKLLNRVRYFFAAYSLMRGCDTVYALDWFAAGLPVALAARMRGMAYVVRVGGDYLWEQKYLESGMQPLSLKEFYRRGLHRRASYGLYRALIQWVLSGARFVICNSEEQKKLYEQYYHLARTGVIGNPALPLTAHPGEKSREFVFWGRLIVMKNIATLIRAFAKANIPSSYSLRIIGDGPQKHALQVLARELGVESRVRFDRGMPREQVLSEVQSARALVLPSWTDISPNQVSEALAIGLPVLVTKENYLAFRNQLPSMIDPSSVEDVVRGLEMLADEARYEEFTKTCRAIRYEHSWEEVLREHLAVFTSMRV